MYIRMGSVIEVVRNILFDGENISFDASLVICINGTSIPQIAIINRIYGNRKLLYIGSLISP